MPRRLVEVTPSASRLTSSLRDIGYEFTTAIADLVDNSVSAEADTVDLEFVYRAEHSYITVADNGSGMTTRGVEEALRFGSRREYGALDLGRFGLGLKTASLSQGRRVTVLSRHSLHHRRITARTLDLDHIISSDRWHIYEPSRSTSLEAARRLLADGPGSVILLQKLDRLLAGVDPSSGWAKRRLEKLADETAAYLGMVFHRFIEGSAHAPRLTITVNGEKVLPWNPFAVDEEATQTLPAQRFSLERTGSCHDVVVRPYILPPRAAFSTQAEFDRLAGPNRWNRQQGLYIYRADRLVQSGGWAGLRGLDEHTKLARLSLDFPASLDELFSINVAKMRVAIPSELREALLRTVNETCSKADATYRRAGEHRRRTSGGASRRQADLKGVGLALQAAAIRTGHMEALDGLMAHLGETDPELCEALGFGELA